VEGNSLRSNQRRASRIAAALGLSAATIPVVLGVLAESSAAATSSGSTTISAQQVVAAAECDIAWVDYDDEWLNTPAPTPPTCAPVPAGVQVSVSTLLYDYCLFTDQLGGNHGICIPPATTSDDT
jgi:hypothetical protein